MAGKALSDAAIPDIVRERALGDVPRERRCLRCDTAFWSDGFGERICRRCKGLNAWRNAIPEGSGTSRRR